MTTTADLPGSKRNESGVREPARGSHLNVAWGLLYVLALVAGLELTIAVVTKLLQRIL